MGETVGQDVLNLLTNFKTCSAKVTVTQLLTGAAIGYGIGVAGNALGGLLADAAEGEAGPAFGCGECFAAGTPVHTDNGAVPIERIKVGDKVWAHNEKTGVNELRTVTSVAPQHRDTLLELRIEGEKNALRATSVHPFYARRNASEVEIRRVRAILVRYGTRAKVSRVNRPIAHHAMGRRWYKRFERSRYFFAPQRRCR